MTMRQDTLERRRDIYGEALAVIDREYCRELTVDAVARELATSRRQLQRVFAEVGGTTFRRAVAEARMRNARRLLLEGSMPVRAVGARVGYVQPAQFSKTFRRHFGAAPSELRRGVASQNGDRRELSAA
jgi:AraC family transcriptional regulator, regulatory protein of adaptative response / methylphosphotriester-DNA alkyltransferase methyltransferase